MALKKTIYIGLAGKKHPINIDVNASALYCDLRDCGLFDYYKDVMKMVQVGANPGIVRDMIYTAIENGYRKEKKEMPEGFDNFFVGENMDEMTKEDTVLFVNELVESLPKPKEEDKVAVKKKRRAKKEG